MGNIRLLEGTELEPGGRAMAQIFLNDPAVASWNQPFVVRRQSPVETIGGGRVLHTSAGRIKKPTELDLQMIQNMRVSDPLQRAAASVYLANDVNWQPAALPQTAETFL